MPKALTIRSFLPQREVDICLRVREVRLGMKWSQPTFAAELSISRERLASYEYAKAPIRYVLGSALCEICDINQRWLATGALPMKRFIPPYALIDNAAPESALFSEFYDSYIASLLEQRIREIEQIVGRDRLLAGAFEGEVVNRFPELGIESESWFEGILSTTVDADMQSLPAKLRRPYIRGLLDAARLFRTKHQRGISGGHGKPVVPHEASLLARPPLTSDSLKSNHPAMHSPLASLIARVKRAASAKGQKAELARFLGVAPARVTEWLAGQKEPGGETTLRLLAWVEQQERQP